jgi:hypothetical protein
VLACPLQVMSSTADKPRSRNKPGNIKVQVLTGKLGTTRREGEWEIFNAWFGIRTIEFQELALIK